MALDEPTRVVQRTGRTPFLQPNAEFEITGQVGNVCFIEGLVRDHDSWFLYYGTADSRIAVAKASVENAFLHDWDEL